MQIPDDITPILREIDQSLKEKAIPPHSRPIMAVIEFGNRFRISLPIAKLPPGAPEELAATSVYSTRPGVFATSSITRSRCPCERTIGQ